jgi:ribosomal protein S18 acetylase RimI-like enzyme
VSERLRMSERLRVSEPGEQTGLAASGGGWSISTATEQDIGPLLALWETAGGPPSVSDTSDGLARLLAVDRDALLVAESVDALVGSLIAAWDGWRGSFYRLVVRPDLRRQGLATALLREGERRLRERGAVRLTAIVAHDDRAAMGFWRRAGYEQQLERTRFIRPVEE